MKKQKQIKVSVLVILMMTVLSIGCSKDDDVQSQEPPVVNKAPVIEAQTFTTVENIADDVVIGNVKATDPESKALIFTITKNSNDYFELTEAGELSLVTGKKLDVETTTSYTLTVEVSDGKNKTSADITVAVENVEKPFITTWKTTEANEEIIIGINEEFTYDYTIDWGDGTVENGQTTQSRHSYVTAGTYTVSISGEFPGININQGASVKRLQTIEQWGDIEWQSFYRAFIGCNNMMYNAKDVPNLSKVTSIAAMFAHCTKFNANLNNWDVSNVTSMDSVFFNASSFNGDISNWDVSNVTDMFSMFDGCSKFNSDISNWDVSKVTAMSYMFRNATSYNGDISGWDIQNVRAMNYMLDNTNISTVNYDALLTKWSALPNIQSNVTFGVEGLTYCNAQVARENLTGSKRWRIIGDTSCPR